MATSKRDIQIQVLEGKCNVLLEKYSALKGEYIGYLKMMTTPTRMSEDDGKNLQTKMLQRIIALEKERE